MMSKTSPRVIPPQSTPDHHHHNCNHHVSVMDGGMGYYMFHKGVPRNKQIWSGYALENAKYHPRVEQCHLDFIKHGATTITTANYPTMPTYYRSYFGEDLWRLKILEHTAVAGRLARQAANRSGKQIFVFGALPPCVESYRPDLVKEKFASDYEFYKSYYSDVINVLDCYVDGFILESMGSWREAACALDALKAAGTTKPVSIAFHGHCLDEDTMKPTPQLFEEYAKEILKIAATGKLRFKMIGLNCAPPQYIDQCFQSLTNSTRRKLRYFCIELGAYANKIKEEVQLNYSMDGTGDLEIQDELGNLPHGYTERHCTDISFTTRQYIAYCRRWRKKFGVKFVGGCCGYTPEDINTIELFMNEPRQNFAKL